MVIAWHDAAFTLPDAVLTPELMNKVLEKFHLQHKLKETWTADESKILAKLISGEADEMHGSKTDEPIEKNEEMVKKQEEIMAQISKERLDVKDFRDHPQAHDVKTNSKKIKDDTHGKI